MSVVLLGGGFVIGCSTTGSDPRPPGTKHQQPPQPPPQLPEPAAPTIQTLADQVEVSWDASAEGTWWIVIDSHEREGPFTTSPQTLTEAGVGTHRARITRVHDGVEATSASTYFFILHASPPQWVDNFDGVVHLTAQGVSASIADTTRFYVASTTDAAVETLRQLPGTIHDLEADSYRNEDGLLAKGYAYFVELAYTLPGAAGSSGVSAGRYLRIDPSSRFGVYLGGDDRCAASGDTVYVAEHGTVNAHSLANATSPTEVWSKSQARVVDLVLDDAGTSLYIISKVGSWYRATRHATAGQQNATFWEGRVGDGAPTLIATSGHVFLADDSSVIGIATTDIIDGPTPSFVIRDGLVEPLIAWGGDSLYVIDASGLARLAPEADGAYEVLAGEVTTASAIAATTEALFYVRENVDLAGTYTLVRRTDGSPAETDVLLERLGPVERFEVTDTRLYLASPPFLFSLSHNGTDLEVRTENITASSRWCASDHDELIVLRYSRSQRLPPSYAGLALRKPQAALLTVEPADTALAATWRCDGTVSHLSLDGAFVIGRSANASGVNSATLDALTNGRPYEVSVRCAHPLGMSDAVATTATPHIEPVLNVWLDPGDARIDLHFRLDNPVVRSLKAVIHRAEGAAPDTSGPPWRVAELTDVGAGLVELTVGDTTAHNGTAYAYAVALTDADEATLSESVSIGAINPAPPFTHSLAYAATEVAKAGGRLYLVGGGLGSVYADDTIEPFDLLDNADDLVSDGVGLYRRQHLGLQYIDNLATIPSATQLPSLQGLDVDQILAMEAGADDRVYLGLRTGGDDLVVAAGPANDSLDTVYSTPHKLIDIALTQQALVVLQREPGDQIKVVRKKLDDGTMAAAVVEATSWASAVATDGTEVCVLTGANSVVCRDLDAGDGWRTVGKSKHLVSEALGAALYWGVEDFFTLDFDGSARTLATAPSSLGSVSGVRATGGRLVAFDATHVYVADGL